MKKYWERGPEWTPFDLMFSPYAIGENIRRGGNANTIV